MRISHAEDMFDFNDLIRESAVEYKTPLWARASLIPHMKEERFMQVDVFGNNTSFSAVQS